LSIEDISALRQIASADEHVDRSDTAWLLFRVMLSLNSCYRITLYYSLPMPECYVVA